MMREWPKIARVWFASRAQNCILNCLQTADAGAYCKALDVYVIENETMIALTIEMISFFV